MASLLPHSSPTYRLHRCVPTNTLLHPSTSLFFASTRRHDRLRRLRYSGRAGGWSAVRAVLELDGTSIRATDRSSKNSDDLKPQGRKLGFVGSLSEQLFSDILF